MIDIKADFSGGLNLDDAVYNVPKNSYIDAMNVTTDAISGANDRAITNIIGNQLVNYTLPAGRNVCIGAFPNNVTNTVIYFVWNENKYHLVLEYNNTDRTISPIFKNLIESDGVDVLGFLENKKITSINIYNRDENAEDGGGDLLFFIDSVGRPTTMDIKRFKEGQYNPVERYILDVCKRPPLFPPLNVYVNDLNVNTNNLRNRLFRFKYRYVYDNNERSVCSPIGSLPLPISIIDDEFNNDPNHNNRIDLSLNTGDKDVKSIELLMSYVLKTNDWSDFALVESIDKNKIIFLSSSITTEDNPIESNTKATIKFEGGLIPGTIVNLVVTQLSPGFPEFLAATYTIQLGDNMVDLTSGLVSSLALSPYVTSPSSPTSDSVEFYYDYPYILKSNAVQIVLPSNPSVDNISFLYYFYNDGTYPVIDVAESTQLFDYVPELANAQEMANGNVLIYGGITEGYDNTLVPNVVNTIFTKNPSGIQPNGLNGFFQNIPNPLRKTYKIVLNGIPLEGDEIKVYVTYNSIPNTLAAEYTVTAADASNTYALSKIIIGLYDSFIFYGKMTPTPLVYPFSGNELEVKFDFGQIIGYNLTELEITTANPLNNSTPTFLFSTKRKIGIAYFDRNGKTNGILYSGGLEFPAYWENENGILLPYINTKIYHTPPDWAYSYGFYLTKEATQFLYWSSSTVKSDLANEYLYFDISNLEETQKRFPTTTQVLSYTFQDGDRMRLIKKLSDNTLYVDKHDIGIEGVLKNPSGVTPDGTYIKVKKIPPFDIIDLDEEYLIQIYRPTQQLPTGINEVYYEFGQQYEIGSPGTRIRYHKGMLQDQARVPTNPIICNVSVVTSPFPTIDIATLAFSGVPYSGVEVEVYIGTIGSPVQLASYIIQQGESLNDVVTELYNQLLTHVGTYLNGINQSGDTIEFSYSNVIYSFAQSNVVFTYPAGNTIPAEFNFYEGDVYFRLRRYVGSTIGTPIGILDRNFVDNYISAVNNIEGRPSVIDVNARRAYYSTMVRFGQAYQPNTNINGLNRFFPANFDEYDYSYGDIMRLKVRDRFIRVFQKLKVGKVPLYSQIVKDPSNVQNLIVSDKLINPIAYYVGDLGIGEHAESLASYTFADYFTSNVKGIVARVGEEGVTFLSVDHKMDSWATSNLPLRTGNYKVYGGLDQRIGNYIIALEATDTDPATTLVFDLDLKCFSTFLSYRPEAMTTLGTLFISFKNGRLYTHDNTSYNTFFGQPAADSSITLAFNQNPLDKKTFMSVGEVASQIWDVPVIQTDINSYGTTKMESNLVDADFVELEGTYEAAILRDKNSIGGILEGDSMKGKYMTMKFRAKAPTSLVSLNLLSLKAINSPLNNR